MSTQPEHYVPSGRGPQIIGVYSFFVALTTIVIILRVYVRVVLVKSFGIDDWAVLFGWVLFMCYSGFAIGGTFHGTGQHMELIKPESNIPVALMDWWMCEPLYVVGNMSIKLSIGLMLLRLVVEKSHRMLIYIVVGVIQVYSVVYFFLFVFQCIPSKFFWTRMAGDTNGQCMSPVVIVNATYIYSAITCASDWVLAILPWFLVRNLQMNRRTKAMVAIILAMGSIASAATIVRIPYVADLANVADFLYATTDVAIWSCVETGLAVAASSAATLKPLFKKFLDRSRAYHSKTKSIPLKLDHWPKRSNGRSSYIRTNSAEPSLETRHDLEMDKDSNITKTFEVSVSREQAP